MVNLNLGNKEQILVCILLIVLFFVFGSYSYTQYDALFTGGVEIDGQWYEVTKLRGFLEFYETDAVVDVVSGGYRYTMANPYGLELKKTILGDTAVYYFDNGVDYVVVFIEYQHFIFLKYLFSFLALLYVIRLCVHDFYTARMEDDTFG